ncbi:MAG TPA: hypothetical protein VED66_03295, partial [Candidatus Sulfotelmatobacter sp.]|nr:hypothetical protein [Candidatus Sulfotelmatobacter sp.]
MWESRARRRHATKRAVWLFVATAIFLLGAVAAERTEKVVLFPRLQNGETLHYESRARLDRHVQTKSNVATMLRPGELRRDLSTGLRLSVQEFRLVDNRPMLAAETELHPVEEGAAENAANKFPKVNFTISGDGGVTRADGLDDLDPEQRLTWQFWVAQFAFGWTLPAAGVKLGEKWKSEEVEKTPTPIANLVWERETTYVQNDKCPILSSQQCAVFLISSTLKQKSNPKDTTPEDYQLHALKTSGTARGTNETLAYIS